MKKKMVSIVLTAAMAMSVLVGCGQDAEVQKESTSQAQESKTESSKAEESKAEEPEELYTVKWVVRGIQPEDHDKVMTEVNKLLEERYNLNLDLVPVADGELVQRVELMITSGEEYDMNYTNAANFYTNVAKEAYLPLNDLLENSEWGQKLMEVYPETLLSYGTVDGQIYALPNYQKIYTQICAFIPKDLAEKYELDINAKYDTLADLEPFMDQILENEDNIWPLAMFGGSVSFAFGKNFDIFANCMVVDRDDENYTAKMFYDHEPYVEALRTINEYYKKGYIRSDIATITDETTDLMAGRYAVNIGVHKPGAEADQAAKYGDEWVMIPFGEPILEYNGAVGTMTAISVNSDNPEAALKMLYAMWTDEEIFNMCMFGLEGEHYTKVAEDRVEPVENSKYNMSGKYGWQLGNQFNAWKMPGQADDVWEETEILNSSATASHLSGFSYSTVDVETEYALLKTTFDEYFSYIYSRCIYEEDFDAYIEEWREACENAYAKDVVADLQEKIDAWRAANGK